MPLQTDKENQNTQLLGASAEKGDLDGTVRERGEEYAVLGRMERQVSAPMAWRSHLGQNGEGRGSSLRGISS